LQHRSPESTACIDHPMLHLIVGQACQTCKADLGRSVRVWVCRVGQQTAWRR
jgi:hypothetical protein